MRETKKKKVCYVYYPSKRSFTHFLSVNILIPVKLQNLVIILIIMENMIVFLHLGIHAITLIIMEMIVTFLFFIVIVF